MYDMHGNVWEWCSDWHDEDYYSNSPSVDPNGPSSSEEDEEARCLRGGCWRSSEYALRCSYRSKYDPDGRYVDTVGFRVVRSQS